MLHPDFITFTGADEKTDLHDMRALAARWPVEFGILFSRSRAGDARYPGLDWIKGLSGTGLDLAAHICGAWATQIAKTGQSDIDEHLGIFRRVQINTGPDVCPGIIRAWADRISDRHGRAIEPILQWRGEAFPNDPRISWLYDRSGGRGETQAHWPGRAAGGVRYGYAGGLGPENVADILPLIPDARGVWIDMESRVRNAAGEFDLGLCHQVCNIVYG